MASHTKKPIILKRMIIKPRSGILPVKADTKTVNQKLIKLATIPLYREDIIFESNGEAFLPGEYQSVTIMNKLNNLTSNCQTIAHCVTRSHEVIVKTSDNITQVIGYEAYNSIFYALCSVINQEYKIKAILSLLTAKGSTLFKLENMGLISKACQTDETRIEIKKKRSRKRVKRVPVPYAVKPDEVKLKKVTVVPQDSGFICPKLTPTESVDTNSHLVPKTESALSVLNSVTDGQKSLPDLGSLPDLQDDSNDSLKSFSTLHTFNTLPDLLLNPISLVNNVDKHTKEKVIVSHRVQVADGTELIVPYKPEDIFHIATAENLRFLDEASKKKLLLHQMQIDFKYCLSLRDEDGNLAIHVAVITGDIPLLKRQCAVLNIRKQSVDIPTTNGLTALKLSIFRESAEATSVLLQHGADPFLDGEDGSCAHAAAELRTDHLAHILNHCRVHARSIIMNHVEELQTPGWEEKTDEELGTSVLQYLCSSFDKQGYTPLMLASKLGLYENVRLLTECAPGCVQLAMPTSGDTALFLAVSAACSVSAERGNKSKVVDHYRKTVEILLDAGADPSIDNNYGSNVNVLLQEFNCAELSMLIANKITHNRFTDEDFSRNFDEFILMKEGDSYSIQDIKKYSRRNKKDIKNEKDFTQTADIKIEDTKIEIDITENVINETKNIDNLNNVDAEVIVKNEVDDGNKTDAEVTVEMTNNFDKFVPKGLFTVLSKDVQTKPNVTKNIVNATNKPVITENILLKKPTNPDKNTPDNKPICKIDTVTTLKKVILYPNKRKINDTDVNNPKMKKA